MEIWFGGPSTFLWNQDPAWEWLKSPREDVEERENVASLGIITTLHCMP